MSIKNIFSLLFLLVTVNVYSQSTPNGYKDTVQVKYDKKKGILTVERKDFKTKYFTFKVKSIRDSLQVSPGAMDSMLRVINLFSANKPISDDQLLLKLHDTTSKGIFIFPGGDSPQPSPLGGSTIEEELKKLLAEKEKKIQNLVYGIAGLLLMVLALFLWGLILVKSKRRLQREQHKGLTSEIIELLCKYFDKDKIHPDMRSVSPDELIFELAAKQKELKGKRDNLEKSLSEVQQQLFYKDEKLKECEQKFENHNEELKKREEKFQEALAGEKERINSLCVKMIDRKDLFVNKLSSLDENLARKELVRFSFAYTEMAVAVLDEIRGKNSESGKLNIRLLNGSKEPFGKTFDQHSPENAIDREYILIAKFLSDYGIDSIEDVYFNGDKFQQKK